MDRCPVCANKARSAYTAREMLFGLDESFDYLECTVCECLFISEIPANISDYYPKGYYTQGTLEAEQLPRWKLFSKRQRTKHWLGQRNPLGHKPIKGIPTGIAM